jgi:uncharacterized membrane protein
LEKLETLSLVCHPFSWLMVDGFAPASIVAPLGTVAILCNAVVAPLVFHEKFRARDFTGIVLATAGAVTIVLSAKTQEEKVTSS